MSFNLRPYAKAFAAAFSGALTPQAYALLSGAAPFTAENVKESILGMILAGATTYQTSNGKSVKDAATGIAVSIKLDFARFVAYIVAALPDLVTKAAQAAIAPEAQAAPAAGADILGKALVDQPAAAAATPATDAPPAAPAAPVA